MKNIKYIIFTLLLIFINTYYVNASCTNEEISNLKNEAKKIQITYKHLKDYDIGEGETTNNVFEVTIKNLSDDMYISIYDGLIKLTPSNGEILKTFDSGTWNFEVYSNKCNTKVHEINVHLPRYNYYSEDPLCEGINGEDFPLCGKYYEYDVSYESFEKQVKNYRATHEIKTDENNNKEEKINIEKIINNILDFIKTNYIYFILGVVLIILIIILVIIIKKRKKRGVLK